MEPKNNDILENILNSVLTGAQDKFVDMDGKIEIVIQGARAKFEELEKASGGEGDTQGRNLVAHSYPTK